MSSFLFLVNNLEVNFFNWRSLIVFICILQGAIYAVLLSIRYLRLKKPPDFWLAALLYLLCLNLITPFIGFAGVYNRNQWLTYFPFGFNYTYSVCLWFYVLTLTNSGRKLRRTDLLLFIPSGIYLVFRLFLFVQPLDFKDWFNEYYYLPYVNPFITVTEFGWNVVLLFLSIRHYRKYRIWLNENYSDIEKVKFEWLRNFLYVFTFLFLLSAIFDFTENFFFRLSYFQYFYFESVLALVTYYLAVAGYLRSQPIEVNFSETEDTDIKSVAEEIKTPSFSLDSLDSLENSLENELEEKESEKENQLENLKAKLQTLMETEKPFLDSQLTLSLLAKRLGVNTTTLSSVVNNGFNKNFNDFVNEFRINEVKDKLENGAAASANLLDIGLDAGFNSKPTFNRVFKKFTGVTPKEYQKKISIKS